MCKAREDEKCQIQWRFTISVPREERKGKRYFAAAIGKEVIWHDLGDKQTPMKQPQGELIVVAAPVFAGRIPSVVREK